MKHFVASPSADKLHAETITAAPCNVSAPEYAYKPWSSEDGSGKAVDRTVEEWIEA